MAMSGFRSCSRACAASSFGRADVGCSVEHLAMQIRWLDVVEIDEADASDARRGEVESDRTSQSARADDEHRRTPSSFSCPAVPRPRGRMEVACVAAARSDCSAESSHGYGSNLRKRSPASSSRPPALCTSRSLPSSLCPCPSSTARRWRRRSRGCRLRSRRRSARAGSQVLSSSISRLLFRGELGTVAFRVLLDRIQALLDRFADHGHRFFVATARGRLRSARS